MSQKTFLLHQRKWGNLLWTHTCSQICCRKRCISVYSQFLQLQSQSHCFYFSGASLLYSLSCSVSVPAFQCINILKTSLSYHKLPNLIVLVMEVMGKPYIPQSPAYPHSAQVQHPPSSSPWVCPHRDEGGQTGEVRWTLRNKVLTHHQSDHSRDELS